MPQYQISYNGFSFPYAKMQVSEAPRYAEDRITLEGTDYSFEISGFLNGDTAAGFGEMLDQMRCTVSVPRRVFTVQWSDDGADWTTDYYFDEDSQGLGTGGPLSDQAFGPFPGELKITKFFGGRAAMYSWSVRAFRKDCFGTDCSIAPNTINDVLSFYRRFQHDIDATGLTTRTISGKLRIKSTNVNPNNGSQPADNYRYLVTPSIPINFHRERQSFTQSEDGCELSFSFVDVETKYTLPQPITKGNVNWSVRIENMGLLARYTLSGSLSAPPSVSKATLITTLGNIAVAKFPLSTTDQIVIYETRDISEDVYNNTINFNISASQSAGNTKAGLLNLSVGLNSFTVSPPSNSGVSYPVYPYGGDTNSSSGVIAAAPVYYDNCTSNIPTTAGNSYAPSGGVPSETGLPPSPEPPGNATSTGVSSGHAQAPWIALHEQISYEIDNGIKFFYPKVKGSAPIAQQVHEPFVTIIQAGYARRYTQNSSESSNIPTALPPVITDATKAVMMNAYVSPALPTPIGDGSTTLYTIHWRYVMRRVDSLVDQGTKQLGISYPADPRVEGSAVVAVPTLPELIVVPQ